MLFLFLGLITVFSFSLCSYFHFIKKVFLAFAIGLYGFSHYSRSLVHFQLGLFCLHGSANLVKGLYHVALAVFHIPVGYGIHTVVFCCSNQSFLAHLFFVFK